MTWKDSYSADAPQESLTFSESTAELRSHPLPELIIREGGASDFEKIYSLELQCFPVGMAFSRRRLRHLVIKARGVTWVAIIRGEIVGFVITMFRRTDRVASIESLNVAPHHQRRGVAGALLREVITYFKTQGFNRLRLEVAEDHAGALGLYERSGFIRAGLLIDYYPDVVGNSRNAVRMFRPL